MITEILLGIVQGLTEWFPISSSGHLAVFEKFFGLNGGIGLNIFLHLGTLLAVIVFFFPEIIQLFTSKRKILLYIFLASIPTAVIGFIFSFFIESLFSNLLIVALSFLVTGSLIFLSSFFHGERKIGLRNSFIAGILQGIAVIPGISRSGIIISSLMMQNVKREEAAKFAFLLAIPAVIGANLLEFGKIVSLDVVSLSFGFVSAFFAGLIALFLLFRFLLVKWRWFAYYCWILGFLILLIMVF